MSGVHSPAHERRSRLAAWALTGAGVAMLVAAGYLVVTRAPAAPALHLESVMEHSILVPGQPLSPRTNLQIPAEDLKKTFRVLAWSRSTYRGRLDTDTIERLMAEKQAEVLQDHLAPACRERLSLALRALDDELRDLSVLVEEENEAVMDELAAAPESKYVHRLRKPFDQDPRYARYLEARAAVDKGKGAIWGRNAADGEAIQFLLPWQDFPSLKALQDERQSMIDLRQQRIRGWLEAAYRAEGMAIFAIESDEPDQGRRRKT